MSTPQSRPYKELYQFITFCTRAFFDKVKEYPLLYLEVFFAKGKSDVHRIQWGDDEVLEMLSAKNAKKWNSDDEIEVKSDMTWSEQVGVAVGLLLSRKMTYACHWVQQVMDLAAKDRMPTEFELARLEDEEEVLEPDGLPKEKPVASDFGTRIAHL